MSFTSRLIDFLLANNTELTLSALNALQMEISLVFLEKMTRLTLLHLQIVSFSIFLDTFKRQKKNIISLKKTSIIRVSNVILNFRD